MYNTSTVVVLPSSDAVFHSHAVCWSVHTLFIVTNYVLMYNAHTTLYRAQGMSSMYVWIWDFGLFKRKHNVDDSYIIQTTDG